MGPFDARYVPSVWEPIANEVERYERSGGTEPSELVGPNWMILWTIGARSGNVRKTPLVRVSDGEGNYCVIGSAGGSPTDPAWVHNLRTHRVARIQDGADVVDLTVREADGDEKETWWALATKVWPDYDAYQQSTDRVIPLFILEPAILGSA